MANTSRINGMRPLKYTAGSPYTGEARLYYVASAGDEILVGDVVKLGSSADANGIPSADIAGVNDVPVGVVVGVMHSKFDPVGKMNSGSTALDVPAVTQIAASGSGYIMVADNPQIIFEIEAGTGGTALAATDVGLNGKIAVGSRDATTRTSPTVWDTAVAAATTSTYMLQLIGFTQRVGNEIGASAKLLVRFNVHQYQSVGTTGV